MLKIVIHIICVLGIISGLAFEKIGISIFFILLVLLINWVSSDSTEDENINDNDEIYKRFLLILLSFVMKADGKLKSVELDSVKSTIRRYYKTEEEQKAALKEFQKILKTDYELNSICDIINNKLDDVGVSELFMELLAVAYADDNFSKKEKPVIKAIRDRLGLTTQEYQSIYSLFQRKRQQGFYKSQKKKQSTNTNNQKRYSYDNQNYNQNSNNKSDKSSKSSNKSNTRIISIEEQEACGVLGVKGEASNEEIKKAYKALAIKYHPDRVSHLGEETIRQATETMKQINIAWETVKDIRGIN